MRLVYGIALITLIISSCLAESNDGPLVLGHQGQQPLKEDAYYPPATEPYNPNPVVPNGGMQAPYNDRNSGAGSPMQYTYSVPSSTHPVQPAPSMQPISSQPPAVGYGAVGAYPFPASRDLLEKAADRCDEEVAQIWAQRNNLEPYRRAHFQKCIGQAKVRCDKLKELAKSIKLADEQLYSYQIEIQNAQKAFQ